MLPTPRRNHKHRLPTDLLDRLYHKPPPAAPKTPPTNPLKIAAAYYRKPK